jgi:hypothetical protein
MSSNLTGPEWTELYGMLCDHTGHQNQMMECTKMFHQLNHLSGEEVARAAMQWMSECSDMPTVLQIETLIQKPVVKAKQVEGPDPSDKAAMARHRAMLMVREQKDNERLSRRPASMMSGQPAMLEMLKAKVRCAYYFKPDDRRRFLMEAQLQAADNGIEWEDLLPTDLPDSAKKLGLDSLVSASHAI